ncbi:type II toxin-antitoxin system RelE/ParE family toxin [Hoylesella enoeca]|uniref:Addiction module toxin RelE n=1 Tax=Hoylesella enoeca TaxID=76123 RepID=A0A0S2KHL8_9BACT|nr:type II toxin-antitoxin system RelE/ParE family toxin [Hoylesella enoeca]ALO47802.1 addiction module toxin RelE [Hoylesella enoeca]
MKVREVVTYKNHFDEFFKAQTQKVRDKIIKVLDIVEQIERIPQRYLKYIEGTNGLFEIRIQLGNNIFRVFCFFDGNRLVVLLSGFQKKTQKTPRSEIVRAERLMNEYYEERKQENKI